MFGLKIFHFSSIACFICVCASLQESDLVFEFSVKSEHDTCISGEWDDEDDQFEPFRTVMVFKKERFPTILDQIRQLLQSNPLPVAQ